MMCCLFHTRRIRIAFLIVCLLMNMAAAQSGRRVPRKSDPPAPVQPPSETEPEIKKSEKSEAPPLPIAVMKGVSSVGDEFVYSVRALEGCADKLSKAQALSIEVEKENKNRAEASNTAKASSKLYVVWMELHFTSYARNGYTQPGSTDAFYLDYALYEPGTGKVKTSGRIYQRPYYPGGVIVPSQRSGVSIPIEYSIRQAGEDVAERILSVLNVVVPTNR